MAPAFTVVDWRRKRSFKTVSTSSPITAFNFIWERPRAISTGPTHQAAQYLLWGSFTFSHVSPRTEVQDSLVLSSFWTVQNTIPSIKAPGPSPPASSEHTLPHAITTPCVVQCASSQWVLMWKAAVIQSPPNSRAIWIVMASAGSSGSHCCLLCCLPFRVILGTAEDDTEA